MTTETVKRELNEIADHLETYGWYKGEYWEFSDEDDLYSPCCLVGAFYAVREKSEPDNVVVEEWFADLKETEDATLMALLTLLPVHYLHTDRSPIHRLTFWSDTADSVTALTTPLRDWADA